MRKDTTKTIMVELSHLELKMIQGGLQWAESEGQLPIHEFEDYLLTDLCDAVEVFEDKIMKLIEETK